MIRFLYLGIGYTRQTRLTCIRCKYMHTHAPSFEASTHCIKNIYLSSSSKDPTLLPASHCGTIVNIINTISFPIGFIANGFKILDFSILIAEKMSQKWIQALCGEKMTQKLKKIRISSKVRIFFLTTSYLSFRKYCEHKYFS